MNTCGMKGRQPGPGCGPTPFPGSEGLGLRGAVFGGLLLFPWRAFTGSSVTVRCPPSSLTCQSCLSGSGSRAVVFVGREVCLHI